MFIMIYHLERKIKQFFPRGSQYSDIAEMIAGVADNKPSEYHSVDEGSGINAAGFLIQLSGIHGCHRQDNNHRQNNNCVEEVVLSVIVTGFEIGTVSFT